MAAHDRRDAAVHEAIAHDREPLTDLHEVIILLDDGNVERAVELLGVAIANAQRAAALLGADIAHARETLTELQRARLLLDGRRCGGRHGGPHNKARPTLPRASDLPVIEADGKRTGARDAEGRFAAGNRVGRDARVKHSLRRSLGSKTDQGEASLVARDAHRICGAYLRSLPSDAAPVRAMAVLAARHAALAGFYGAKATEAGLTSVDGMRLQEMADKQSQRAERVLVTALDIATKIATRAWPDASPAAQIRAALRVAQDEEGDS